MIVDTSSSTTNPLEVMKSSKGNKIFLIYGVEIETKPSKIKRNAWIHLYVNSTLDFIRPRNVNWFQMCYILTINTSSSSSIIHSKPTKYCSTTHIHPIDFSKHSPASLGIEWL